MNPGKRPYLASSDLHTGMLIFLTLLILFFWAPLTLLLIVQTLNFMSGQTTSARMKMSSIR